VEAYASFLDRLAAPQPNMGPHKRSYAMTRADQKKSERRTLDAVLNALGLCPDQEPQEGEAPDFTMPVSGRVLCV
jgi:hypothetical protein